MCRSIDPANVTNDKLTELESEYYIEHLKKTSKSLNSSYSLLGLHHAHLNRFIQDWVKKLPAGSRILDGGCGLSIWVTEEIRNNYDLRSMDCQEQSVEFCRRYYKDDRYFVGDLYSLPFEDGSVDAVVLREVIEHVKTPMRAVCEIFRVLCDGGYVILTTPNYSNPSLFIIENIYHRFLSDIKPYLDDVHPSRFRYRELRGLLGEFFEVVEYGTIDLGMNLRAVAMKSPAK